MTLKERIVADMKAAMREKDTSRLETIRLLRAAIQRREIDERLDLDDGMVVQIVRKLVKQFADSAEQFARGGRTDLVDKEQFGIAVLESYLPEPLSDAEIAEMMEQAITSLDARSVQDMGKVMKHIQEHAGGRADMGRVSARVKSRLS